MNPMNPRPRLQHVATLAEVSIAAASRILRGDTAEFSGPTCERVVKAAKQLGWRRNLLVHSLQTGRSRTVGVVVPPYDSFWVNLLSGVNSRLAAADFLPINVWPGDAENLPYFEAGERESVELMNRLLERWVDGLILWPPFAMTYHAHSRDLTDNTVPVVLIDYHAEHLGFDTVATDEFQGAALVAEHLLELGHRRFAFIGGRETAAQTWAQERRQGVEKALGQVPGVSYKNWKLNSRGDDGLEVARRILRSSLQPTAIVAATDHQAVLAYQAAAELGLRIPEDLSVTGFADLDFAVGMIPPLTTVRQRASEIGRQAASVILGRLDGTISSADPVDIRIPADLVVRSSTAPPRPPAAPTPRRKKTAGVPRT